MKILQICHKPPFPAIDGGCLAIRNITLGLLHEGMELDLLTIETDKHPFDRAAIPDPYGSSLKVDAVYVDTKVNIIDAFSNIITSDSYNVSRFFTPDVDIRLTEILRKIKYDVIHLESLFVTPYIGTIRRLSKAKIVLRSHNLEYMIWERLAKKSGNAAKRMYLSILAKQLKRYELNTLKDVDGIVSISFEDAEKYKNLSPQVPLINIPFGTDPEAYPPTRNIQPNTFFHLGSLAWKPNYEGIVWFLKKVWTPYASEHPDARFLLAGRDIPAPISEMGLPGVEVVGEVPDAKEFIANNGVMIVPLRAAGGIRVKIIEGMSLGIPIISTAVGAEGIHYEDGRDILIGNSPEEFVEQMKKCSDAQVLHSLGANARKLSETEHNNHLLSKKLVEFYNQLHAK